MLEIKDEMLLLNYPDLGYRGKELFDHVLKQIDNEPARWNQKFWGLALDWQGIPAGSVTFRDSLNRENVVPGCGSAYCVAGWACVLSGDPLVFVRRGRLRPSFREWGTYTTLSGEAVDAKAQELLGLSLSDADQLFAPDNTRLCLDELAGIIWPGTIAAFV